MKTLLKLLLIPAVLLLVPFSPDAKTGDKAPELEGQLLNGEDFYLSDYLGEQVILVNFFATWCVPCREELPILAALETEFKNVLFVAVDGESVASGETSRFVADLKTPAAVVNINGSKPQRDKWGVFAVPSTFIIDKKGRIDKILHGSLSKKNFAEALKRTLKKQ